MPDPRPVIVTGDENKVEFPGAAHGPLRHIATRIALAVALVTFVALLTFIGRGGYVDPEDGSVSPRPARGPTRRASPRSPATRPRPRR